MNCTAKPNPFPKTIFENVAYGPRIHGLAHSKSELDGLTEFIDPYTSARNGVVKITATQLVDIAVAYEKAFNKITLTA